MTAAVDASRRASELGLSEFLPKPVQPGRLRALISSVQGP
jgi:hypothetical protein